MFMVIVLGQSGLDVVKCLWSLCWDKVVWMSRNVYGHCVGTKWSGCREMFMVIVLVTKRFVTVVKCL